MFDRVLFPTDFSPFADRLVDCLDELHQAGTEEIVLLHVLEPWEAVGWTHVDGTLFAERKGQAAERLAEVQARLEALGFRVRSHVVLGFVAQEIVRVAREVQASLIAMGTHGHGFFPGAIVGSVTHNVVRHTPIPVLVHKLKRIGPPGQKECEFICHHIFERVLVPTDFSACAAQALALVRQLRGTGTKEVIVLHVQDVRRLRPHLAHKMEEFNRTDSERLEKVRKHLEYFGFQTKILLREGVPFQEIDRAAREEDVSLILMGSHGRSAIADVLLGSVADAVVCRHPRPVLV